MKKIGYIDGRRLAGFTLAGVSGLDGIKLDINDIGTPPSGANRGVHINYTQDGAKPGAECDALAIDLTLKKATQYAYPLSLYMAASGNPALDFLSPISIYTDNLGTGVGALVGIDIGLCQNDAVADRLCFMRMRKHGSQTIKDGIRIEGTAPVTNLFAFEIDHTPIVDAAIGGNQDKKIRVKIVNTDYYIPLHSA